MNAVRLILSLAIVLIIGIAGSYFTSQSVKTWYPTLQKPFFTPTRLAFCSRMDYALHSNRFGFVYLLAKQLLEKLKA
ncbi:MAG: tryptophan-rich sensory protein [Archaeoglobaceae archaeon]